MLGRLERGWVVASETAALDIVGASFVREVEPGELIAIDDGGLRSIRFAPADPKGCLFEYVYLARPDTTIARRGVHQVRVQIGRTLAFEHPVDADIVVGVPESGIPAAEGYAEASGFTYVGLAFIQPSQMFVSWASGKAQPDSGRHRRTPPRGRRRLDRRGNAAGAGEDAAMRPGLPGPRPHLVAARRVALLLASTSPRAELIAPGMTSDEICLRSA